MGTITAYMWRIIMHDQCQARSNEAEEDLILHHSRPELLNACQIMQMSHAYLVLTYGGNVKTWSLHGSLAVSKKTEYKAPLSERMSQGKRVTIDAVAHNPFIVSMEVMGSLAVHAKSNKDS